MATALERYRKKQAAKNNLKSPSLREAKIQKLSATKNSKQVVPTDTAYKIRRHAIVGKSGGYDIIETPGIKDAVKVLHRKTGKSSGFTPKDKAGINWAKRQISESVKTSKKYGYDNSRK